MSPETDPTHLSRRDFVKAAAAATVAGSSMLGGTRAIAKSTGPDGLDRRNERPDRMEYRRLGRTNFMCSRLAFGCGAALAGGKAVHLLEHAFEAGINFYDSSSNRMYKGTEAALAPFLKKYRDEVWVSSKAAVRVPAGKELTLDAAQAAARLWTTTLEESLKNLDTDYLDSYYYLGVGDPRVIRNEEMHNAFLEAKQAGKVAHLGFSTHENARECLEAAIDTGWFDIAMVAITPAGWFDLRTGSTLTGRGTLRDLRPLFDRARATGMGLIGMKAARYIAGKDASGESREHSFDYLYDERLMLAPFSPFQRSYAFVLENGLDVVNADMQNIKHFGENLFAARTSKKYFA